MREVQGTLNEGSAGNIEWGKCRDPLIGYTSLKSFNISQIIKSIPLKGGFPTTFVRDQWN